MEVGTVRQVDIDSEMRAAYLDYAMSVIVSRALPDARDGLKPVHRRILYAMHDMGLRPNTPYRKSARIVGEVLGKYHPHGDAAVYDAMVRLAQDFSMRYPLVDGQGNFGSIDGDAAAAMRYTEARMYHMGRDMLIDIEKATVDFAENFDGSLYEPSVLPASMPNMLVNGASGIAVGMSTSIPPHNLVEVCDALMYMLDNWEGLDDVSLSDLMNFIKGPDFPTGGVLFRSSDDGSDNLAHAYATGRGKLTVQAKVHIEQLSRNRNRIIVTELPYQTNKTSLIERIATLARDERIEGLTDLRDESDRNGMRIVIDLTRTVDPYDILDQLYRMTPMRQTFSVIMLALVDDEPRMLSLKQALRVYLEHRFEIVRRRSEYDLERARERAHILEGYLTALDNLDEVIALIRKSRTAETASSNLQRTFKLSEAQAAAILNMPLRRLAALERKRIEDEYKELITRIEYLANLLESPQLMRGVIKQELDGLKDAYGDSRRTLIVDSAAGSALDFSELLPDENVWVVLTENGRLSRTFSDDQPRVTTAVKEAPHSILSAATSEVLYLITSDGEAVTIPVHQLPQAADFQDGAPYSELTSLQPEQQVVAALTRQMGADEGYLVLATRMGEVKRIIATDLPEMAANAFQVMIVEGDEIGWAAWTTGDSELLLITAEGKAIRFSEDDVRPMGLRAGGVKGIKLASDDDCVVGMDLIVPGQQVWVCTESGFAKSSPVVDYPVQGRYGQGVITYKLGNSRLACGIVGPIDDNLVLVTSKGKPKYMRLSLAPDQGRNSQGSSVIALGASEVVSRAVLYQRKVLGVFNSSEPLPEDE